MYKNYGKMYKVFVELNEDLLKTQDSVLEFIKNSFPDLANHSEEADGAVELISLNGHSLVLLWSVPEREGSHEIENALFYTLEAGKYGTYSYEYVR